MEDGEFVLKLDLGLLDAGKARSTTGFRIGVQSEFEEYLHRFFMVRVWMRVSPPLAIRSLDRWGRFQELQMVVNTT